MNMGRDGHYMEILPYIYFNTDLLRCEPTLSGNWWFI